jgi:hypothetical protein
MKAQGALEYIIVIATALAVTGIVSALVMDYFGPQQTQYNYATCRQAASSCKTILGASPDDSCSFCNTACNYSNGTEIFPKATSCCLLGESGEIYDSSPGCSYCSNAGQCPGGLCCSHQCKTQACTAGVNNNPPSGCPSPDACHYYECQGSGTCGAKCVLLAYLGCCLQDMECQDIPYDCATPKCVKLNQIDTYKRCNYTATPEAMGTTCGEDTTVLSCNDLGWTVSTVTQHRCYYPEYPKPHVMTCMDVPQDSQVIANCPYTCQLCSNGACVNATATQCSTSPLQSCFWCDCSIYNHPECGAACIKFGQLCPAIGTTLGYCNCQQQSQS